MTIFFRTTVDDEILVGSIDMDAVPREGEVVVTEDKTYVVDGVVWKLSIPRMVTVYMSQENQS